ncbi:hypothetical protein ACFLWV_00625 [Chloroflexota bacterium]
MTDNKYPAVRLSEEEFSTALHKGLGRAFLHVTHFGLDDVADLVLEACLHDQAYDPQCEESRAKWLFDMFSESPYYPKFRDAILNALKIESETWDLQQLFEIAQVMAMHGDKRAVSVIRERAIEKASQWADDGWLGAEEYRNVAGIEGALELARIYGQRLLNNPEDWVPSNESFDDLKMPLEFQKRLLQESEKDPALKAYWDYLEARGYLDTPSSVSNLESVRQRNREDTERRFSLDRFLYDAIYKSGRFAPSYYSRFAQLATKEELEKVYSLLLSETDNEIRLRLLRVFRLTPLPQLPEEPFSWVNGDDAHLREASYDALAQLTNKRVHELAIERVKSGKLSGRDRGVLDLFINNYENNDSQLITNALLSLKPDEEDAHNLGRSLINLAESQKDTRLANALRWAYETTPCSDCRHRVIIQLDSLKQFNNELLYECQFDAIEGIRMFAQQKLTVISG